MRTKRIINGINKSIYKIYNSLKNSNRLTFKLIATVVTFAFFSCNKALETKPTNLILADAQFATDSKANDAIVGIYATLYANNSGAGTYNSDLPLFTGLSADELNFTGSAFSDSRPLFNGNVLNSKDPSVARLWSFSYNIIYQANAAIENVAASKGISPAGKKQFTGEAKFLRAFCYFYLVNMFGDVPLITGSDYHLSSQAARFPVNTIYSQIVTDLTDASNLLSDTYATEGKVRANKSAAIAFLARVYLYTGDWANAQAKSAQVIKQGNYSLESAYSNIFLNTSKEAILQFYTNGYTQYGAATAVSGSPYILTSDFVNTFENGDLRKNAFTKTSGINNNIFYANKYQNINTEAGTNEYYTVMRLAELYLIRAEALAQQGNIMDAAADINRLRSRAGLTDLPGNINKGDLLSAIVHERRVELCFEWGDRWFNLKRSGNIDAVLVKLKKTWTPTADLYPIPLKEIQNNSKLTQNPGY